MKFEFEDGIVDVEKREVLFVRVRCGEMGGRTLRGLHLPLKELTAGNAAQARRAN
jgi:hypothetical protein